MRYHIRRYCHGLGKIRQWLPLVFLPPVVYLLAASAAPDRFSVIQKIAVQKTAPIALSRTPVDIMPMAEMTSRPAELFLDEFAVQDLAKAVQTVPGLKKETASRNLRDAVESSMTLKPADDAAVLLSYYGDDAALGKMLVNFYTQRLVSRSKDGQVRSMRDPNRAGAETSLMPQAQAAPQGEMYVQEHRAFWRPDRLLPSAGILAGALGFWFILAGFVELADPAFKSERQISRYLDLPVIGVMPDLNSIKRRFSTSGSCIRR